MLLLAKMVLLLIFTFSILLPARADIIVAADGSGQYTTIQAAITSAPNGEADHPTIIRIKPGIYHELIDVPAGKAFLRLVGDNPDPTKTVVTYGLYAAMLGADGKPIGTFSTATVKIDADNFTAENISFVNSAGAVGQALAVRIDGDRDAFKNCRFDGWQDTILDNLGRHYYDDCTVTGAVDFIFGGATAVYDHCDIIMLRPSGGVLTAPSTPQTQKYGLVFLHCDLIKGPGVKADSTQLMRPWRPYGMSAFINCTMDDHITPAGWRAWDGRELTCRALEYGSVTPDGQPVNIAQRAPWGHELTETQAAAFTLVGIFGDWNPATLFPNPSTVGAN